MSSTSERTIPTLKIEEVTATEAETTTESRTPEATTTTTVEIAHRGSPVRGSTPAEEEYAYDQDEEEEEKLTTTTTEAATERQQEAKEEKPQYEYEYYYEYYDDNEEAGDTSTTTANARESDTTTNRADLPPETTTTGNEAAFQNLLGLIHEQREQQRAFNTHAARQGPAYPAGVCSLMNSVRSASTPLNVASMSSSCPERSPSASMTAIRGSAAPISVLMRAR